MFSRLLVANRGEIACRVIRTARRLGLRTIAVYSDADRDSLHVAEADEAHRIGPAAARDSYLAIDAILAAAAASRAEAVHPGYGFLAENPRFAEACAQAGLVFVGPPAEAMRALGAKDRARTLMARAGVPVVPGDNGENQDESALLAAARRIGFPVLVKPVAGGGGKGMRVVATEPEFGAALAASRREAKGAFADDRVILEKYVARPRHVEVQVFADAHGNVVHLHERDCSIQRRHQKVIEEAPAPGLPEELRRRLAEAAVGAARAAGYVGAGTVEFLVANDGFYFLEMNTRLQVEHPVTEMVTGLDLVEWQLRVAAGEPLPLRQSEIRVRGHAIEARLYAENPERQFLPSTGRIEVLRFPETNRHLRVDCGIGEGDAITHHYDPMIAKLIVWDSSRVGAVERLGKALDRVQIVGVATNVAFLRAIAGYADFATADIDTGFIERHRPQLLSKGEAASDRILALAALAVTLERAASAHAAPADPCSPWRRTDGWRLGGASVKLEFEDGDGRDEVVVEPRGDGYALEFRGRRRDAVASLDGNGEIDFILDGVRLKGTTRRLGAELALSLEGESRRLRLRDPVAEAEADEPALGSLVAPMPGAVRQVLVKAGQRVGRGAALLVLEAMKMEHVVRAPADGVIETVHVAAGDQVADGAELVAFKAMEKG